jgi:hypothetical protein
LRLIEMRKGYALAGGGVWVAAAGAIGFAVSAVFSSVLRFQRGPFVLVHAIAVGALAVLFFRGAGGLVSDSLGRRPLVAFVVGLVLGAVLIAGVVGGPGGAPPAGARLVTALGWYGLVYGVADALLLTVIPVVAVGGRWVLAGSTRGRVLRGAAAFAASLLVTALYHAGFAEFHGAALLQPLIGNAIVTAGYLLTGNLATPLLSHVLMHAAAVVHGMEATAQLPPHY